MAEVQNIEVTAGDDGARLDRWLRKNVPYMPYSLMQRLFRKRAFKIDGKRAKGDQIVNAGQIIKIPAIEVGEVKTFQKDDAYISEKDKKLIRSMVIFEDDHIIAINKPAGIAVQGGTKIKKHIDDLVIALVPRSEQKPKIVHRLDKDTSGVMILAKTDKAARELGFLFKGKGIRKYYWALVVGNPSEKSGTIRAAIRKGGGEGKERMIIDEIGGKKSTTDFYVVDHAHNKVSFMAFWPRTGRTHQIRVHSAQILGCPILGDGKYAGQGAFIDTDLDIMEKVHLHAKRMIFPHPITNKVIDINAPLPEEMERSWKALGFNAHYKGDPFEDHE